MQSRVLPTGNDSPPPAPGTRKLVLRLAESPDEAQLFHSVGAVVDGLYPNGREKLMAKLLVNTSLRDGSFVASIGDEIVAYAAETQKAGSKVKLSTFWVREDTRGQGVGRHLLEFMIQRWKTAGLTEVFVTVRRGRERELLGLLSKYGFTFKTMVPNRYGPGRDEAVLTWNPSSYFQHGTAHALVD